MLVKKTKATDNCTTQSLTIINQRRSWNETARMISHGHGSNKHRPMHPSSNRTCFLRIWGIYLLTLLVPNMLSSLCNNALTCIYSKQIQNMCVYCENVRLSMENWPIWLHNYCTSMFVHSIQPCCLERSDWITKFQLWTIHSMFQCLNVPSKFVCEIDQNSPFLNLL